MNGEDKRKIQRPRPAKPVGWKSGPMRLNRLAPLALSAHDVPLEERVQSFDRLNVLYWTSGEEKLEFERLVALVFEQLENRQASVEAPQFDMTGEGKTGCIGRLLRRSGLKHD